MSLDVLPEIGLEKNVFAPVGLVRWKVLHSNCEISHLDVPLIVDLGVLAEPDLKEIDEYHRKEDAGDIDEGDHVAEGSLWEAHFLPRDWVIDLVSDAERDSEEDGLSTPLVRLIEIGPIPRVCIVAMNGPSSIEFEPCAAFSGEPGGVKRDLALILVVAGFLVQI